MANITKMKNYLTLLVLFFSFFTFAQKKIPTVEPNEEYRKHLNAAKSHNINLIQNKTQLDKYVKKKKLERIAKQLKGFYLLDLTHSHPYLTPKAKEILRDIAYNFYKKNNQQNFAVTSLTRTVSDQNRLRSVNKNASINESAHSYGSTFDISYVRFNKKHQTDTKLEKKLEDLLKLFRSTGKIYYVKEKQMKCYHITVRNY